MNDFIANYMVQPGVDIFFTGNEDDSIFNTESLARHERG
jgi:hypothetical protein